MWSTLIALSVWNLSLMKLKFKQQAYQTVIPPKLVFQRIV